MKRINNIYSIVTDLDTIIDMYDNSVRKNTKNKIKIEKFENFYSENIKEIKEELINYSYIPGKYNIFMIREPKVRIIMSQSIKDKIVNHLVARYFLIDIFDKRLIDTNVATRKNKGTHYGLNLMKKYLNIMKNNYDKFYILKFDISKYFYNIDHDIVKEIVRRKIKDKHVLEIISKIIDATDSEYINNNIEQLKRKEISNIMNSNTKNKQDLIKEIMGIPIYQKGKGLPIGNMTSQIIATFYLDKLDHFIKNNLKIKYYIRYMDDGVLIHHDKNYLKLCLKKIEDLVLEYGLTLNKKTKIYSNKDGIEFLGFNFIINKKIIMKVKKSVKKRFKRKVRILYKQYDRKIITYNELQCIIASYIGRLQYGDCQSLLHNNIKV